MKGDKKCDERATDYSNQSLKGHSDATKTLDRHFQSQGQCHSPSRDAWNEVKADRDRLREWVDDLHSGMYINCVYCGHRYGPDDGNHLVTMQNALREHVEQCPEHPMSQLKADNARLREALKTKQEIVHWAKRYVSQIRTQGPTDVEWDNLCRAVDGGGELFAELQKYVILIDEIGVRLCHKCFNKLQSLQLGVEVEEEADK